MSLPRSDQSKKALFIRLERGGRFSRQFTCIRLETKHERTAAFRGTREPPPITVQEAVQCAEKLSRFLQEQPNIFDSGSQSRFQINIVGRVNRLLVANLTASRQSQIGDFFGSCQRITSEEEEGIDLED
jgi:hypothetical protein